MTDPNIMGDPTSLLSTIMETIATLYSIFVAIFILSFQNMSTHKNCYLIKHKKSDDEIKKFTDDYNKQIDVFKAWFILLAVLVCAFEAYNGIINYFVSDSIFNNFVILLLVSYALFILLVFYIIGFSYALVNHMISLDTENPVIYDYSPLNINKNFDFFSVIAFILLFFMTLAVIYFIIFKATVLDGLSIYLLFHLLLISISFIIIFFLFRYIAIQKEKRDLKKEIEKLKADLLKMEADLHKVSNTIKILEEEVNNAQNTKHN